MKIKIEVVPLSVAQKVLAQELKRKQEGKRGANRTKATKLKLGKSGQM